MVVKKETKSEKKSEQIEVIKRLNVLIRLILEQQIAEKKAMQKDQLVLMDSVGLTSSEIAEILGRETKDISSLLKRAKDEKIGKRSTEDSGKS